MGKDKSSRNLLRKNRGEEGSGRATDGGSTITQVEFIGFSAFAAAAPLTPALQSSQPQQQQYAAPGQWGPVYTGLESNLNALFARLVSKRDVSTQCKSIGELANYLGDEKNNKRFQIEALTHFGYLFLHKLAHGVDSISNARISNYSNRSINLAASSLSSVRAACVLTWINSFKRIPKATIHLVTENIEIAGLLYCWQVDPSAEVRQVATDLHERVTDNPEWLWRQGLVAYARHILSYGRESALYDGLNKQSSRDLKSSDLTSSQQEILKETYARILSTVLSAVTLYLSSSSTYSLTQDIHANIIETASQFHADDVENWCKFFQVSSAQLRRCAYELLSTVSIKHPELVKANSIASLSTTSTFLANAVSHALSIEKIPGNVPLLVELLLAIVSTETLEIQMNERLSKPLAKLIRQAGYGAHVDTWAPTLLPLVAKTVASPIPLIEAIVSGRAKALGQREKAGLLVAQIECSNYLLLRTQPHSVDESETTKEAGSKSKAEPSQVLVQVWLDAWKATWQQEISSRSAGAATTMKKLVTSLATSWIQFETADRNNRHCCFASIRHSLWDKARIELLSSSSNTQAVQVVLLFLESIQSLTLNESRCLDRLISILQDYVTQNLKIYQSSSSAVPSYDDYELYIHALHLVDDPADMLPPGTTIGTFLMNDLLRWMILHTSQLSTGPQTSQYVHYDFTMLALLLAHNHDLAKNIWPKLFHELVQAKLHVSWCTIGLRTLLQWRPISSSRPAPDDRQHTKLMLEWIRCSNLNEFAIEVGTRIELPTGKSEGEDTDEYLKVSSLTCTRLDFFRLCVGLDDVLEDKLVDNTVVVSWVEHICPLISITEVNDIPVLRDPDLLTVLLEILGTKPDILYPETTFRVLFALWLQGSYYMFEQTLELVGKSQSMRSRFLTLSSTVLVNWLDHICDQNLASITTSDHRRFMFTWADAAFRLVQVAKMSDHVIHQLDSIGLVDAGRWRNHSKALFFCLKCILMKFESPSDRFIFIESSSCEITKYLVLILVNALKINTHAVIGERTEVGLDQCSLLIISLGGNDLGDDFLDRFFSSLVTNAVAMMRCGRESDARSSILALSLFLRIRFRPIRNPFACVPDATSIKVGDIVWYILNPDNPAIRERVMVTSVHHDVLTGYYFSIRHDIDDNSQERQTVIERLRLSSTDSSCFEDNIAYDEMNEEKKTKRVLATEILVTEILEPFYSPESWVTLLPKLIPLLCGTIGLGIKRGIDSMHYFLVQLLRKMSTMLTIALQSGDTAMARQIMLTLALSGGYSLYDPNPFNYTFELLSFDAGSCIDEVLNLYDLRGHGIDHLFDQATLVWLSTLTLFVTDSFKDAMGDNVHERLVSLVCQLALSCLANTVSDKRDNGYTINDMAASRALFFGFSLLASISHPSEKVMADAERAARALIFNFCSRWENRTPVDVFDTPGLDWRSSSYLFENISLSRRDIRIREMFVKSLDYELCEELSQYLFVESKRHICMYLLNCRMNTSTALFAASNPIDKTHRRLQEWIDVLEDEEAEEIKNDLIIVNDWLPRRIIQEIEDWDEEVYENTDDEVTIGRMLMWLCVLNVVDTVSTKGFRYRPAFVSYLNRSGSVYAALNMALIQGEAISDLKEENSALQIESELLSREESYATVNTTTFLVLFRSAEVLPTLFRRWWEEYCPRTYVSDVKRFVERLVAPEILQRELSRIRASQSSFGDMDVKSSLLSREIAASYVQDDFTLECLITIPPAFPLQSAVVDCSKTLGISQARWRRWSLQITLMLNTEGGTLQDALLLWKDNVEKEFEGIEPCPVCYSVLHVKTHKLPCLQCRTCHNRFHVDCLTQWFRSSGNNACVICQQPWKGTRV